MCVFLRRDGWPDLCAEEPRCISRFYTWPRKPKKSTLSHSWPGAVLCIQRLTQNPPVVFAHHQPGQNIHYIVIISASYLHLCHGRDMTMSRWHSIITLDTFIYTIILSILSFCVYVTIFFHIKYSQTQHFNDLNIFQAFYCKFEGQLIILSSYRVV